MIWVSMERDFLRDGVTAISASASTLTGWALAIFAGTVVVIVSTDYLRPPGKIRYAYLLFVPGWFLLGVSILYGEKIMRRFVAGEITPDRTTLRDIGMLMSSELAQQRLFLLLALTAFGCWLVSLLIWWVFSRGESAHQ